MAKPTTALIAFALIASACSGSTSASSTDLAGYQAAMQVAETEFQQTADGFVVDPDDYAVLGELVGANFLFDLYESRLGQWRSIEPPAEIEDLHLQASARLREVQDVVAMYLTESSLDTGEFDFDSISAHPEIRQALSAAVSACRALDRGAAELGIPITFANNCEF